MKNLRDGNDLGFRLEASDSINLWLHVIFSLHDRRIRPYSKYLKYEIEKYPLEKIPWTTEELLVKISDILTTGNYKVQQEIMIETEKIARKEGFGNVFDSWEGDEKWTMTYEHKP